ncbi:MAG: ComEC/Rec2 family competence protein [Planctomycetota bacterium]
MDPVANQERERASTTWSPLLAAGAWAISTTLLTPWSLPLGAATACLGLLFARRRPNRQQLAGQPRDGMRCDGLRRDGQRRAGLWALPAVLAAAPLAAPPLSARVSATQIPAAQHAAAQFPAARPPAAHPVATQATQHDGPVRVCGRVVDVVRAPLLDRTYVTLAPATRLVAARTDLDIVAGDRLSALARSSPASVPGADASLRLVLATIVIEPGPWSWRRGCQQLRRKLERELLRMVPGEHGATLSTLVLGRATRTSQDVAEAHRATGLSHLLAVSGAHAAMLAFLLGLSGRRRQLGASRARAWFVLVLLLIYGSLAGAEPPVLRALVAFVAAAVAARTGRPFGIAQALLLPALVTCLLDPLALRGPSFLLSYAAVFGLGLALRGRRPEGLAEHLADALRASLWATLLTAPLTLWFFGQLAPWTILLTPLLAPLVAIMLLLGLCAGVLALLSPTAAAPLGEVLRGLCAAYTAAVQAADALPGTPIPARASPPTELLVSMAVAGGLWILRRPTRRRIASTITLASLLWFIPPRATAWLPMVPATAEEQLTLCAVGHGQAALLQTDGYQVLVDCGSLSGGYTAARAIDVALRDRVLDLLVITHADQDHHNGVPFLLSRVWLRAAVLPVALRHTALHQRLEGDGVGVRFCAPGTPLRPLAGSSCELFAPVLPTGASDNDQSLWLRASLAGCRVMMSGDAEELGIAAALAQGIARACDVLVLPHHGRANGNAAHLLRRARPAIALASATVRDGPTELGRLAQRFGADVYTTSLHGTVTVSAHGADGAPAATGLPVRVRHEQHLLSPWAPDD